MKYSKIIERKFIADKKRGILSGHVLDRKKELSLLSRLHRIGKRRLNTHLFIEGDFKLSKHKRRLFFGKDEIALKPLTISSGAYFLKLLTKNLTLLEMRKFMNQKLAFSELPKTPKNIEIRLNKDIKMLHWRLKYYKNLFPQKQYFIKMKYYVTVL